MKLRKKDIGDFATEWITYHRDDSNVILINFCEKHLNQNPDFLFQLFQVMTILKEKLISAKLAREKEKWGLPSINSQTPIQKFYYSEYFGEVNIERATFDKVEVLYDVISQFNFVKRIPSDLSTLDIDYFDYQMEQESILKQLRDNNHVSPILPKYLSDEQGFISNTAFIFFDYLVSVILHLGLVVLKFKYQSRRELLFTKGEKNKIRQFLPELDKSDLSEEALRERIEKAEDLLNKGDSEQYAITENSNQLLKEDSEKNWFKVGLLFAKGIFDNRKESGEELARIYFPEKPAGYRPYITSSKNFDPNSKGNKNIFRSKKNLQKIIDHCINNSIPISKKFQTAFDSIPTEI